MTDATSTASTVLPSPTGPHAVGRTSADWVDHDRADVYAADPAARRELVVWIWYPATSTPDDERAEYLPAAWAPTGQFIGLDVDGLRSNAVTGAPVAAGAGIFPVLVLSPSGFPPLLLAALAEDLASHGYVVVGVNHTYETAVTVFADGRVVALNPAAIGGALGPQTGSHHDVFRSRADVCRYKAADLAFVVDELERMDGDRTSPLCGRLDLGRLGAVGHSMGGDAALEWCRADARCRAAVNLDGALWSGIGEAGLDRPALQVLAEHPELRVEPEQAVAVGAAPSVEWFEAEQAIAFEGWRHLHERATPGHTVRVAGATHLSFMDVPHLPLVDGSAASAMLAATTIDAGRMSRITSDLVQAFFERYFDGVPAPLLDGACPGYPELTYGPA
jgi:hypothetical protein